MCAKRVVTGVRGSSLLLRIRPQDPHQFTSGDQITQLEGLAVAIAHSIHRDHFVQAIVIARSSDRDRSEATLGTSVS
jgi:hypothetical protein